MSLTVPFEFYVTCATFGTKSAMPSAWKLSAPFNNHVRLRTHSATTLSDGTRSNKQGRLQNIIEAGKQRHDQKGEGTPRGKMDLQTFPKEAASIY